jgi:hypothetical protein
LGIHPGVLLLTILIAIDSWFVPYQDGPYQIAYYTTDGKAFTHGQARKLMVAKFFASFLAVALSVPYWSALGFIDLQVPHPQALDITHQEVRKETGARTKIALEKRSIQAIDAITPKLSSGKQSLQTGSLRTTLSHSDSSVTDRGAFIASIQRLLSQLVYRPGPADGILGTRTRSAIRAFQQEAGLPVDGEPSQTLLSVLRERSK